MFYHKMNASKRKKKNEEKNHSQKIKKHFKLYAQRKTAVRLLEKFLAKYTLKVC